MQPHAKTILVVEDDPGMREIIRAILFRSFKILEADSEEATMQVWNTKWQDISLVIADLCIPYRTTGTVLVRKLQAKNPFLKAVFISGFSQEIVANELTAGEKTRFIQKPFAPQLLLATVQACYGIPDGSPAPPLPMGIQPVTRGESD